MSHKIEGFGQAPVGAGSGRRAEPVRPVEPAAGTRATTTAAAADDLLTLTSHSRQVQRLAEAVAAAPDVSARRVEALRALIEKGHYEVDARRIADRLIDFERELAGR